MITIELIKEVATRLSNANLTINLQKSKVFVKELPFLGYVISKKGISVSDEKIAPIVKYATPKSIRDVRRFIGMAGWYQRLIPNYSDITAPLTDLISSQKKKINWSEKCESAFNKIKNLLCSEPVLTNADFSKAFTVQTDASDIGIAGVLLQKDDAGQDHVICYFSKKLTKAERKFTVTERECLAVLRSIQQFRPYLEMRHFDVITDHHSLVWLKNVKDPNGRLSRWALQLQQYDFTIQHRPGKLLVVPDALSRSFDANSTKSNYKSINAIECDKWYRDLKDEVKDNPDSKPDFRIEDDVLMKNIGCNSDITRNNWRIVVPNSSRIELINKFHVDLGAHSGYAKTYARLCENYWWPLMFKDVKHYIRECKICKEVKAPNYEMNGPMGKARIPKVPFEMISLDFKGPFVRSNKGNKYLLVITDQLSKFVTLHPMRVANSENVIKVLKEYFLMYGVASTIIEDNGSNLGSRQLLKFLNSFNVDLMKTPRYHPQANPTERVNRRLGEMISSFIEENHKLWDSKLPELGFALRTSVHEATRFTPYEIVFGMKMRISGENHKQNISVDDNSKIEHLENLRKIVQSNLFKAHEKSKVQYDRHTRTRTFRVNQQVYVRNFKLSNAINDYSKGIARNWKPGIITQIVGGNRYEITAMNGKKLGIFDIKDIKL